MVVVSDDNHRDLQFPTPQVGDLVWGQICGCIQVFDGTTWLDFNSSLVASNGLYIDSDGVVKLGGTLSEPTEINTDASNTLAISGLQEITPSEDFNALMVNTTTGVVARAAKSSLFPEEVTLTIAAVDGQNQFATP